MGRKILSSAADQASGRRKTQPKEAPLSPVSSSKTDTDTDVLKSTAQQLAPDFAKKVLAYYDEFGRKHLPWQQNKNPYRVWLSEIMLQQTQVATVIPYYQKFIEQFPDVQSLAAAEADAVMSLWAGLGYYSRARNLHRCAQIVVKDYQGVFPQSVAELEKLPGIGRSTAGAILSLGMGKTAPILDGNVKRVLARVFCVEGWYGQSGVLKQLWQLSEILTPSQRCDHFNQAMMDLGAEVCKRATPACELCPLADICQARLEKRTAELPHRKPTTKQPLRPYHFLLLKSQEGDLYLEQRPPAGIWGGLWCLPTLTREQLRANARPEVIFTHTLTHFKMQIHIWPQKALKKKFTAEVAEGHGGLWHNKAQLKRLGLPTPIAKYLLGQ